jgi:mono/diheme cytochrome c family protein
MNPFRSLTLWLAAASICSSLGQAPENSREIQALFEQHCYKCHGPEKQKGGLRFNAREGALKKGDSGEPAIVPGHSSRSRVIELVSSADEDKRMPPKGERLSDAEVDLLKKWIDTGAEWPEKMSPAKGDWEMRVTDEDRKHWSFLPLRQIDPPPVKKSEILRTAIDAFIVAKLEEKGLTRSAEADPLKVIRRIYFDLVGLPPTPEQINDFRRAADKDYTAAVHALVDELLASPHYGERWARHWLDLARYADSNGQEGDQDRPTAHHYRDFVIRALNQDMPFDQFVRWQLAGDEFEPDNSMALAATGFIVAGPHTVLDVPMEEEKIRNRFNELDDMIATTGSAMLGLTLGCARCHDHKYDAIPTRDYYSLLSAFISGNRNEVPLAPLIEARRYRQAETQWKAEFDAAKTRLEECTKSLRMRYETASRLTKINALEIPPEQREALKKGNKELEQKFSKELKLEDRDVRAAASEEERQQWDTLSAELKTVERRKPDALPTALAFADFAAEPRGNWLLARGDFRLKKEPVWFGVLTVLTRTKSASDYWNAARAASRRDDSTQQRRALAEWMTDGEAGAGALIARVIVNRLWQHHFGEGLVRTVNDFGTQSEVPSHPELLEWLSQQFVKSGWKLKTLHRLIMTSSVYLQSTEYNASNAAIDPDNRFLWRRRPLRLESEILRDAMLAVSGTLNPEMFGPAFKAPIAPEAIQARNLKSPYPKDVKDSPATHRRTIYMFHKRVVQNPLMQAFDGPDAAASCGRRESTTVAPQALALLNDPFVRQRAEDFASRLKSEAGGDFPAQVWLAWRIALGRDPAGAELETSVKLLDSQEKRRAARTVSEAGNNGNARDLALADFCQAVFAMNEFIYVD